jgi:hypothetical protein
MRKSIILGMALLAGSTAQAAVIDFEEFWIRGGGTATELPGQDGVEFVTAVGGDKAGYGTSYFDGMQFESLQSVSFLIENAPGPWMPYINIWITDGLGNYAIVANEPSNPEYNPYYANYPYAADNTQVSLNLTGMTFKIHETLQVPNPPNTNYGWLGGDSFITYAELAASNWTIADPTNWGGTGAPKAGHGFNLVYGDTLSNYVSGDEGYVISNVTINGNLEAGAVVPIPAAAPLGLLGMGLIGLISRRRKKSA